MKPEERSELEHCMAALGAGDAAFVFTLIERFGGQLTALVLRTLREMGRHDLAADRDEVDGMVTNAALFLFDHAAGWQPDGALPWVWAERGLRAQIAVAVGHRTVADETGLESEVEADGSGDLHLGLDADTSEFTRLAQLHDDLALVIEMAAQGSNDRDRQVFLEYRLQLRLGDRSPASTVADMFGLSPANARQIHHRVGKRVTALLSHERYRHLVDLPFLAA